MDPLQFRSAVSLLRAYLVQGLVMIRAFRWVALLEGITTLALFLVAMPLKYFFDYPALIRPVGMAHGGAWLLYIAAMLVCLPRAGLSAWQWVRTFVAALFPFGTFLNDAMLKRHEQRDMAPPATVTQFR